MNDVTSILVVLDRSARDTPLVSKALTLARQLNARIGLFSCHAEHEYALMRAYDRRGVEAARLTCVTDLNDYLRGLSYRVTAQEVAVSVDVVCESSLHEAIVRKVIRTCPDLVMKAAAGGDAAGRSALDWNDWELVRTCPVPLLLSRGREWSTRPRFTAAVDVADEATPRLLQTIIGSAAYLSEGCHGELDLVFCDRFGDDAPTEKAHAVKLRDLAQEVQLAAGRVWMLTGDPATTLAAFAAEKKPDVLVIGALAHQGGDTGHIGTLTHELVGTVDCDFVLLRPRRFEFPVRERTVEAWASQGFTPAQ